MGKNVYTRSGLSIEQTDSCCTANSGCVTPPVYSPEDIIAECIFTDKVYDAILIREEADQCKTVFFDIPDNVPEGTEIINATITCSVKPNGGSSGVVIEPKINSINGHGCPSAPTPIGSGADRIPLDFIDTSECDAEGRGTPIVVDQEIDVYGEVLITISGTASLPNGNTRDFTVKKVVRIDDFMIKRFARLCIPSTFAAQKPYLTEFCAVLCDAILPLGLDSLEIVNRDGNLALKANLVLLFCIVCEKKIIVPVQLCVLSTGFCQPEEQEGGLCVEFPRLFPEQVNVRIIGEE